MDVELGIGIGTFKLGNKTYGSTGADNFTVGQLY